MPSKAYTREREVDRGGAVGVKGGPDEEEAGEEGRGAHLGGGTSCLHP